jgi:hypothetical protein
MLTLGKSFIDAAGIHSMNLKQMAFLREMENKFKVSSIEYLYYAGLVTGFAGYTYSSGTVYLALDMYLGSDSGVDVYVGAVALFDESNTHHQQYTNNNICYDGVSAIDAIANDVHVEDIYFGRIDYVKYSYMKFLGFKLIVSLP